MPNWKKLITSGSDAYLNSLNVATNVTADYFFGTASYVDNLGEVFGYQHTQSIAAPTWNILHNLGTRTPVVQVFDTNYKQILPKEVENTDVNTTNVTFDYSQAGYVILSKGNGITDVSVKTSSYADEAGIAQTALLTSQINDQASSGYVDIGAMRMVWGVTNSGTTMTGTFAASFASTPTITYSSALLNSSYRVYRLITLSTTGFTATCKYEGGATTTGQLYYQAIGLKP